VTDEPFETELDVYRDRVTEPLVRPFRSYGTGEWSWLALELARDHVSERYWPAVGERYGGDGWEEHVEE
jgi:hypothetical protein